MMLIWLYYRPESYLLFFVILMSDTIIKEGELHTPAETSTPQRRLET